LNSFLVFFFHFFELFRKKGFKFGVDFGQTEVNDHSSFGFRVIEKVSRLDVPMVDSELFQVFQADEKFINVVLDVLNTESVEKGLNRKKGTMKGLNLKYSKTI
jgi:hypothetical protein